MKYLRGVAIVWNIILLLLIYFGPLSQEKKGAVTWGQTSDIWAMTIAISDLQYGLKGGLGFRDVESVLAAHMTAKKSSVDVNDIETRDLASKPELTTAAIRAATSLDRGKLVGGNPEAGSYVILAGEDIGLAHFYKLAFQVFGYDAYSTRNFYMVILTLSFVLFIAAFWRSSIAIALITLVISALFAVTTSSIFHPLMPSLSANRFLSTLTVVPLFHLICAVLGFAALNWRTFVLLVGQSWLLLFVISARSSGAWALIAFALVAISVVLFRLRPLHLWRKWPSFRSLAQQLMEGRWYRRSLNDPGNQNWSRLSQIGIITLTVFAVSVGFKIDRDFRLDGVYFGEGALGTHLRWHNAYIALAMHPAWPGKKPYKKQNDVLDDNISWEAFYEVAAKRGIDPHHPAGLFRIRILDQVIRDEYLMFAAKNPFFMLELLFVHKPLTYLHLARTLLPTISLVGLLLVMASTICAGILLSDVRAPTDRNAAWFASSIVVSCAQLPAVWAYAASHAFADQMWSLVFLFLLIGAALISRVVRQEYVMCP
jgi:hypothetical protein